MTNSSRSSNVIIIFSGLLVAVIIVGTAVFALSVLRPDLVPVNFTSGFSATTDETTTAPETNKETPKNSANGTPAYRDISEYSNFKPGLDDTSKEFAQIVGTAYVENYKKTGLRDVVLPLYSPEDNQMYDMECKHFETYARCDGGIGKRVYMN